MNIFLLNGPAGCGKDTAAEFLTKQLGGRIEKFARPIKDIACNIYCKGDYRVFNDYDTQEKKNIRWEQFLGKSPREVQIAISELLLKPLHGEAIFGKMCVNRIIGYTKGRSYDELPVIKNIYVSDSGFRPEALELIEAFGYTNVHLIRIHRDGYNFNNDSRGYISLSDYGVKEYDIDNIEGEKLSFLSQVEQIVRQASGE